MKKLLCLILLFIFYSNYSQSSENSNYSCISKQHNDISNFKILKNYNEEYLVFSHSIMGISFINFGKSVNGRIQSYMSKPSAGEILFYSMDEEKNNKRLLTVRILESNKIKNLNSKSVFYGKKNIDKVNLKLSDSELKNEINNWYINFKYLVDLNKSGKLEEELRISTEEEYSCEKANNKTVDNSKPLKSEIGVMKLACVGENPYPKRKKFCECYGDWFYENLNKEEFAVFLYSSKSEKKKFVEKNEIVKQCELYSEYGHLLDNTEGRTIIKMKP